MEVTYSIQRKQLFDVWLKESRKEMKITEVFRYIVNHFSIKDINKKIETIIMDRIRKLTYIMSEKWTKSYRMKGRFEKNNCLWLEGFVNFPELETRTRNIEQELSTPKGRGRPAKTFNEGCNKTKRHRIQPIIESFNNEEILYAAEISLRTEGKRDAAFVVQTVATKSSREINRIKKDLRSPEIKKEKLNKEEALATFLDGKMTKRAYETVQQRLNMHGFKAFPSYPHILEAKKECYPYDIKITEISAEVPLQRIIDHTTKRLCILQEDVLLQSKEKLNDVTIIFKWGCDGTSNMTKYKQRFQDFDQNQIDSSMFVISMVPLQMFCKENNDNVILWQNTIPSSTRFCRPIKILLRSENTELIKAETANIENEIGRLISTKITVEGTEINIKPVLIFTMVDGKICNSLMNVSSQRCFICKCGSRDMNEPSAAVVTLDDPSAYRFGLSPLHMKIRCFECLLKIAYRLEIQEKTVKKENKEKFEKRKEEIKKRFYSEMGLLIDMVKPGYGTSNDDNTARRFFQDPLLSSNITDLDEDLITRFAVMLQTISCNYEIDPVKFQFANNTLQKYLSLYHWYLLPPTVHKLLVHCGEVIKNALLPIGQLSEEAQEYRHKEIKRYRQFNTRKCSRKFQMEDIFHMLLVSSDPIINSYRQKTTKPVSKLLPEVFSLLSDSSRHNYYDQNIIQDNSGSEEQFSDSD